ncbi:MAG: hypothetical protein ABSF53_14155 [Terracidiphilus sp.]
MAKTPLIWNAGINFAELAQGIGIKNGKGIKNAAIATISESPSIHFIF